MIYFYKITIISYTLISLCVIYFIEILKTITTKDCLKLKVMHSFTCRYKFCFVLLSQENKN
ncbi:unnamed protein product [Arabidopsis thaliana]|uniref:Uncharacterized protein n=2 Tax=Arabidopsis TaxID=3701 RepID=A0A5S9Y1P5_ARATH|nr:hypothetical protein ISN45_At05g004760 [Arabidopsis thaliana x Arabidopsis arenosa]CAA0400857.1 unnamed protein product [Arabidopsis thaliana]VYS65965.1 unnamed protein product [Arabidopsis thaliana]